MSQKKQAKNKENAGMTKREVTKLLDFAEKVMKEDKPGRLSILKSSTDDYRRVAQKINKTIKIKNKQEDKERERFDELRKKELFLDNIIEQSPVSTWIADKKGTNIRQNKACRDLFGIKKDSETVGKYNLFKDDVLKKEGYLPKVRDVFQKGKSVIFDLEYPFGSVRHVQVTGARNVFIEVIIYPIKDKKGDVVGAVVQHRDKTESRYFKIKTEAALRSSGIGIWDWDVEKNELIWDDNMYNLYGVSRSKFKGAYDTWEKAVHPDDLEQSNKMVKDALSGKREFDIEFRVVAEDGEIRHLKGMAEVLRNDKGDPVKMIGVNWDITNIKKTEEKLRESESRFHELFDNMRLGVAIYKVEDKDGKVYFKDFNRRAEELEGIKRKKVVGREIVDVFPGAREMGVVDLFVEVYRTGESVYDSGSEYVDDKGNLSYRDSYIFRLPNGDVVSIYDDVTKRVEEIKELEKLNNLMVGRELKMIELKEELKELKKHVNKK